MEDALSQEDQVLVPKITHIVFDMDNTLILTGTLAGDVRDQYIKDQWPQHSDAIIQWIEAEKTNMRNPSYKDILYYIAQKHNKGEDVGKFYSYHYNAIFHNLKERLWFCRATEGVEKFFEEFASNYKIAICSNASIPYFKELCEILAQKIGGKYKDNKIVVGDQEIKTICSENVGKGKPNTAMVDTCLPGIDPNTVIVVGDHDVDRQLAVKMGSLFVGFIYDQNYYAFREGEHLRAIQDMQQLSTAIGVYNYIRERTYSALEENER